MNKFYSLSYSDSLSRAFHTCLAMERFCQETYREGLYHKFGWYGREINHKKAFQYFHDICRNYNFPPALVELAICYLEGRGVERDPGEAIYYLRRAENQGSSMAANLLGKCHLDGSGVDLDKYLAAGQYTKAWQMVQRGDTFDYLPFYVW